MAGCRCLLYTATVVCDQSHYIEVAQGDIVMEQKMRFGLVLGEMAILKKMRADYEQLLRVFFSCFQVQKKII